MDTSQLPGESWMVRPCEVYKQEYKACNSFRGRFNEYFVTGEVKGCKQWKDDLHNCMKWRKIKQLDALSSVINSERQRQHVRMKGMVTNDTWQLRLEPISENEWNKPLPEYITKDDELSYLYAMKKKCAYVDNTEQSFDTKSNSCSVM